MSIQIRDRIWNASACWSSTQEQIDQLVTSGIGVIVGKTCTMFPRAANNNPVYDEVAYDLRWNRMGLPNNGYEYYRNVAIHTMKKYRIPYILSLYVQNDTSILEECLYILRDYQRVLVEESIPDVLVELNVSCPNDKDRIPGYHCTDMYQILSSLSTSSHEFDRIRFGIKLPPYFEKYMMNKMADVLIEYVNIVAYIVCSNTIPNTFHPTHNLYGGLSASPVNRMISTGNIQMFRKAFETHKNIDIKIVGCGGIHNADHIREYLRCGADVVQLGSAFYNQFSNELRSSKIRSIISELEAFL
jgi:dihydroorotate dehydrogenase (fumarate)